MGHSPHLPDGEVETQDRSNACPRPHTLWVPEPGFKPGYCDKKLLAHCSRKNPHLLCTLRNIRIGTALRQPWPLQHLLQIPGKVWLYPPLNFLLPLPLPSLLLSRTNSVTEIADTRHMCPYLKPVAGIGNQSCSFFWWVLTDPHNLS